MTTETTSRSISKVVRIGTLERVSVFCKISYKDGKLSISGVEGPMGNGDCKGSAGQIIMGFKEYDERGYKSIKDIKLSDGWTRKMLRQFFNAWNQWHLNDMQAGCEHQRANWDTTEKIEVVTYHFTREAHARRRDAEKQAKIAAAADVKARLTPEDRALLKAPYSSKQAPDADSLLSGCYEVDKRETKAAGWVRQDEHPRGLLSKPCEVCGYKYGSKWLKVEVPGDVLEFLESLPDTDKAPAWV